MIQALLTWSNPGFTSPPYNQRRTVGWTVIIPTMWRSSMTIPLLESLNESFSVAEIIIIDNSPVDKPHFQFNKVQILEQSENIFVNPAWNLGIQHAQHDLICICNDDVAFNPLIFRTAEEHLHDSTVIGCHEDNFQLKDIPTPTIHPGHAIGRGWGCILFLQKKNFTPIPKSLKIWCGDDWLVVTQSHTKRLRFCVRTVMSTTSGLPGLNVIAQKDKQAFIEETSEDARTRLDLLHFSNGGKFSFLRRTLFKRGHLQRWNRLIHFVHQK